VFLRIAIGSRVSQPDAVLLGYPLQEEMSISMRQNDLIHYDPVCLFYVTDCFFHS